MPEMIDGISDRKQALLDAILMHVVFDGWSDDAFSAASADCGYDDVTARGLCPRGAIDLAVMYHQQGDSAMIARARDNADVLSEMRYSDRVATLIEYRIDAATDKDAVRKASVLFAMPKYASEGAKLIWGTADIIWNSLGDTSDDVNWYSKRTILSGVYGATVVFWLGDESENHADTRAFIERRIANVMQFEKAKGAARKNPILSPLMSMAGSVFAGVKAPVERNDLPGRWAPEDLK